MSGKKIPVFHIEDDEKWQFDVRRYVEEVPRLNYWPIGGPTELRTVIDDFKFKSLEAAIFIFDLQLGGVNSTASSSIRDLLQDAPILGKGNEIFILSGYISNEFMTMLKEHPQIPSSHIYEKHNFNGKDFQNQIRDASVNILEPGIYIEKLLSTIYEGDVSMKGKALEKLSLRLFQDVDGLDVIKSNARLHAEEIDLLVKNDLDTYFWRWAGSPIIVECKNWSKKVGARVISVIAENLRTFGPDAKTAILIAPNGITGDSYSDAVLKTRECRKDGMYIIIIDKEDLLRVGNDISFMTIIEEKYEELLQI